MFSPNTMIFYEYIRLNVSVQHKHKRLFPKILYPVFLTGLFRPHDPICHIFLNHTNMLAHQLSKWYDISQKKPCVTSFPKLGSSKNCTGTGYLVHFP
ncbi:unnamed protein product [Brugia timori]|uniref:Uncharacterized protein n=1 Tax=Brugia timori TaxID=42155 RepID=A0A3P7SRF5_9BILA|nr:unnamed protein product [Brugia timori]